MMYIGIYSLKRNQFLIKLIRFHPPLVYGRKGDADVGEGICCCVGKDANGA